MFLVRDGAGGWKVFCLIATGVLAIFKGVSAIENGPVSVKGCLGLSPYSGRDCVKSLRSSCTGLYSQRSDLAAGPADLRAVRERHAHAPVHPLRSSVGLRYVGGGDRIHPGKARKSG